MAGSRSGVATLVQQEEPRAVFTHCYGHALNLACSDSLKGSKLMKDALDIVYEIVKLDNTGVRLVGRSLPLLRSWPTLRQPPVAAAVWSWLRVALRPAPVYH